MYYWAGGSGNWSDASNWRYDSATGTTASEYPGTKADAEVHIEPTTDTTVTLNVSPAKSIKSITMNGTTTFDIGNSNLTVTDAWSNTDGVVNIGTGNVTLPRNSIDEGTWNYTASRTGIVDIEYGYLFADNNVKLVLTNTLRAYQVATIYGTEILDFADKDIFVSFIIASTVRLYGNQNITNLDANGATSSSITNVEFYGNTGNTAINVFKIVRSSTPAIDGYVPTLKCNLSNGTDQKVLDLTGITNIGTLEINGNATNKLGITATTATSIALGNAVTASNLRINYSNITFTRQTCVVSDGTSKVTAADFTGNYDVRGTQNGWQFPNDPSGNFFSKYIWVGGNGNWSEYNAHWRYDSIIGPPANEFPGDAANNAEVYIQPTTATTVTLNVSPANPIKTITLNKNITFDIGDRNLTVSDKWTNGAGSESGGVVTVTQEGGRVQIAGNYHRNNTGGTGHVELPPGTHDFGTWEYRNTVVRDLVEQITVYNTIECSIANGGSRTVASSFTAKTINLSNKNFRFGNDDSNPTYSTSGVTVTVETVNVSGNGYFTINGTNSIVITKELNITDNGNFIFQDGTLKANIINCNGKEFNMRGTNNPQSFSIGTFNYTRTSNNFAFPANAVINGYGGAGSNTQITNNGNLTFGNAITINGNVTNNANHKFTFNNAATINGTLTNNGTVNFSNSATITALTNNTNGTINFTGATPAINIASGTNNGTVNIAGNPTGTVGVTNTSGSTVNYQLSANGVTEATVNFGDTYGNLECSRTGSGSKTIKFDGSITVNGILTLNGQNSNNMLNVTGSNDAKIIIAKPASGQWLSINHANVGITGAGAPFDATKNCFDVTGTNKPIGIHNGWMFTVDLTDITLSASPLGTSDVFVKMAQNTLDALDILSASLLATLPDLFTIYENTTPSAVSVNSVSLVRSNGKIAWLKLQLSGTVAGGLTIDDLKKYYVSVNTRDGSKVHPISDYAVGYATPLYAYDGRYNSADYQAAMNDRIAIRNFDAEQGSDGSLLFGKDIDLSVSVSGSTAYVPQLVLSRDNLRSSLLAGIWTGIAANPSMGAASGGNPYNFRITSANQTGWQLGDQITFTFAVTDGNATVQVGGENNTPAHNLYAARLRVPGDINSLDVWSFRLRDLAAAQSGGVSIRSNVVNPNAGGNVVIEVNMPKDGRLNVIVMTLSGDVISYLERGSVAAGTHVYRWDGKNRAGNAVARGIYFIRVTGGGIDETRKVMVVK